MAEWHSLYLPSDDHATIVSEIQALLAQRNATPYDPFGTMPITRAYTNAVKAFVAPPQNGWTRILLAAESPFNDIVQWLGESMTLLAASLSDKFSGFIAWRDGKAIEPLTLMANYADHDALKAALDAKYDTLKAKDDSLEDVIPLELRGLMGEGSLKKAEGLLSRMAGRALSLNERAAATALLREMVVDWTSESGQRIRAVMALMPIPNWAVPDYVLLRDAYRQHMRAQRNPNAVLSADAQKLIQAVPNALEYTPLFYGL